MAPDLQETRARMQTERGPEGDPASRRADMSGQVNMGGHVKKQGGASKISSDRRDLLPGRRWPRARRARDGAGNPFRMSYAHLMTALMALLLAALAVELHETQKQRAIANGQRDQAVRVQKALEQERFRLEALVAQAGRREKEREDRREQRNIQIERLLDGIDDAVRRQKGVRFDRTRRVIGFGSGALFRRGRYDLTVEQVNALRRVAPALVAIKRTRPGRRWLKQIVAEGFADRTGSYLYNLNLSLQRSQQVLCALLADSWTQPAGAGARPPAAPPSVAAGWRPVVLGRAPAPLLPISAEDSALIKRLFLVGGHSPSSAKAGLNEGGRIELRIEFYHLDEAVEEGGAPTLKTGRCAVGGHG
jgi:outer membrane protein OmpA-like peptidoglycan-associated protein